MHLSDWTHCGISECGTHEYHFTDESLQPGGGHVAKRRQRLTRATTGRISPERDAARKLLVLHQYWRFHSLRATRRMRNLKNQPGSPIGTIWPVTGVITSLFGRRPDPIHGGEQFHTGIDIYTPLGTPVKAVLRGRVRLARYLRRYGKTVVITHGRDAETLYAHNSILCVKRGQRVRSGQIIGYSGESGRATGPHVHYEVWVRGKCVDPLRHLRKNPRVVLAEVIDRL